MVVPFLANGSRSPGAEQSLAAYDFPGARAIAYSSVKPDGRTIPRFNYWPVAQRAAGDMTAAEQHYARYRQLVEGSQRRAPGTTLSSMRNPDELTKSAPIC